MKYLIFFTLVLIGVLTTEACNPDGHASNHKSHESHEIEYEDVTLKPSIAAQHVETTMKPSSEAIHSTEKAIIVLAETTNKTTPVVAEMVTPTISIVTSMKHAVDSLKSTENPAETIHEKVNKTSDTTPVEMTTDAVPVVSTKNPGKVTPDMMATTNATIHVETSTHITGEMNINKTTAAMMTISSMPTIVTSATVVRRERRQVNGTMKTPTPPNTSVFGSRSSTRAPMPVTRNAGQGTTVSPATAGSRTTMKSEKVIKQPARLSTASRVRTPVTMKPESVTTGPIPVRG